MLSGLRMSIGLAFLGSLSSCKTNTSEEKSITIDNITQISQTEWVEACMQELEDPLEGVKSLEKLKLLANTGDCNVAYPVVKNLVETLNKR